MLDTLKKTTMSSRKVFTKVTLNLIQGLPPELWPFRNSNNAGGRFRIKYGMTCLHNNYTKSGSSRLETCRDDSSLLNSAVRGFTLIELLVVVLIIGILASVALPQYQKAVMKSRYATLKNLTRALADAQEIYYMAHGAYAPSIDELDIGLPDGQDPASSTASLYFYPWGYCGLDGALTQCKDHKANMQYQIFLQHHSSYPNQRRCMVFGTRDVTEMRNQVCKAETGASTGNPGVSGVFTYWIYQN